MSGTTSPRGNLLTNFLATLLATLGLDAHALVERHFEGTAGPWTERRMWRHLRACESCRSRYRTRALLEAMQPAGQEQARARLQRGLFAHRRALPLAVGGVATLLVAGTAALIVLPRAATQTQAGFQERSGSGQTVTSPTDPSITVIRLPAAGSPARAGAVVHADEALAFTYRNPPAGGFRYLMIFARDPAGHLYWYWPAWRDPDAVAPSAVPIAASEAPVELREGVRHPLAPGPLTLHALFTRQALDVHAVEAAAREGDAGLQSLVDRSHGHLVHERVEVLP